jgi:hypothetical protein
VSVDDEVKVPLDRVHHLPAAGDQQPDHAATVAGEGAALAKAAQTGDDAL